MVLTGFSPCWQGYYISSMGGAGLVFDNLGINMLSLVGKAPLPSVLYLNRNHGEEIEVEVVPVAVERIWQDGRTGAYALTDRVFEMFGGRYPNDPRILVTGPAAQHTDMGGILSVPITKGRITPVDTWAGRGGLGSAMLQNHGIVAIIYGGTQVDEDFRDRKVADEWFQNKFSQRLAQKDLEVTTKYRYDEKFNTGGTFGVNYAGMGASCWPSTTAASTGRSKSARPCSRTWWSRTICGSSTRKPSTPSSRPPAASPAPPCARKCTAPTRRITSPTRPWGPCAASSINGRRSRSTTTVTPWALTPFPWAGCWPG